MNFNTLPSAFKEARRMIKNKIIIIITLIVLIPNGYSFSDESQDKVLLGFVDSGFWHETGTLLVGIDTSNSYDFNNSMETKYKQRLVDEIYIELSPNDVGESILRTMKQYFHVYSKNGYMGRFKLDKYVALHNACGGSSYLYAKLKGKTENIKPRDGIFAALQTSKKNVKYKIYNEVNLAGKEKKIIEKIISGKLLQARENLSNPYILNYEKKTGKQIVFETTYEAFKFKRKMDGSSDLLLNVIWSCNDERLRYSDAGYKILNTFIYSFENSKITELEKAREADFQSDSQQNILFGIDIGMTNKIKWIVFNQYYEGGKFDIIEWINGQKNVIVRGNYFGC